MHPLNPYAKQKPDFARLASRHPSFAQYVSVAENGHASIDFQNASALRELTRILLKDDWELDVNLREDRLCPTLANRLDYILHVLDLQPYMDAAGPSKPKDLTAFPIRALDVGTGHVAIYPVLLARLRPHSTVFATEIDEVSFRHAIATIASNNLTERIHVIPAQADRPILAALERNPVDFVICNPPFFASAQEMEEGQALKAVGPHAAPTAASNELITAGGEVAFVVSMITESLQLRDKAKWYTSLIGRYASLQPLVDQLRSAKIDNYFVKSVKQAQTTRWILAWSHTVNRIPDTLTRPEALIPGTSFAKLLPPPNRLSHTPLHPPFSTEQLQNAVTDVLRESTLYIPSGETYPSEITLSPRAVTWSRAARRQAARGELEGAKDGDTEPIMVVKVSFIPPTPPSQIKTPSAKGAPVAMPVSEGDWRGATLTLDFIRGGDRAVVDSFWKYLLTKAGLLGQQEGTTTIVDGPKPSASNGRGARGVRGSRGSRGRDEGWSGRARAGY